MSVKISSEQSYAYAEILEILSFTHISLIEKIPQKLLSLFKANAISTYEHHLNKNIPLENQEISSFIPDNLLYKYFISLHVQKFVHRYIILPYFKSFFKYKSTIF